MPTLVFDPQPAAIERLLEERARLDLDHRDEVWEGVRHVIPPPSRKHETLLIRLGYLLTPVAAAGGLELTGGVGIGENEHDYRVPDLALLKPDAPEQWQPSAALVLEIVSPGDKSREKLGFFAAHEVDEVVFVDPDKHTVEWLALAAGGAYEPLERSRLLDLGAAELASQLGWPIDQ